MDPEIAVTPTTRLALRPLVVRREDQRIVVGWFGGGVFFEADEVTVRAINLLEQGLSVSDAQARLEGETGESHDVAGLAQALFDAGLVTAVDGRPLVDKDAGATEAEDPVPHPAFRWLTSWPFTVLVFVATLGSTALIINDPTLAPGARGLLGPLEDPLLALLIATILSLAIVTWHEVGHWAMAMRFGIRSRIGFSARFVIPVMQTDVTRAWILPRTERVLIFMGGMLANVLLIAATLFTVVLVDVLVPVWSETSRAVGHLIVFINLFQIAYQFILVLRTDLYYVFITLAGTWNLHDDVARAYRETATRVARALLGRPPLNRDGRARAHKRLYFAGYAVLLALGTVLGFAFMGYVLFHVGGGLAPSIAANLYEGVVSTDPRLFLEGFLGAAYVGFLATLVIRFQVIRVARGLWTWGREVLAAEAPAQG